MIKDYLFKASYKATQRPQYFFKAEKMDGENLANWFMNDKGGTVNLNICLLCNYTIYILYNFMGLHLKLTTYIKINLMYIPN